MKEEYKRYIGIAILFMGLWGISGLINGDGFFGGIEMQIDAVGDIVSSVIKGALIVGVIWFISTLFKKKYKDE
tara:strand:- start:425 stop:643 length:219 start_codon:yes stop_codon:yes gene_type:complete